VLERNKPAHGVWIDRERPMILFLTVCTKDRRPWLATEEIHGVLRKIWAEATAWMVGRYVLMPDHLHLFTAPGHQELSLETWVRYWKSRSTRVRRNRNEKWQVDHWDTRLRSSDSYDEKWIYVPDNPVRAGLVSSPEDWPYQGELNFLPW
jgi:putative transposase